MHTTLAMKIARARLFKALFPPVISTINFVKKNNNKFGPTLYYVVLSTMYLLC